MYSLTLHNEIDDCLIIELEKKLASNCILTDEPISKHEEVIDEEDILEDERLELSFIRKLEPFEEVYEVKTLNSIAALHKLNKLALKYERCILVKLALSSPFNLRCFALCAKKRDSIKLESNQYIVSNINQIKSFIRLLLAYSHNCSNHYEQYLNRRELYKHGMKNEIQ